MRTGWALQCGFKNAIKSVKEKEKKETLREKVKSQRDVRWQCLNSRVQTLTKKLSQQLTTEGINWHFMSA